MSERCWSFTLKITSTPNILKSSPCPEYVIICNFYPCYFCGKVKLLRSEDDLDFTTTTNAGLVPDLRRNMKAKSNKEVTIIERGDKTFLVCPCPSRSGNSRHKCKTSVDVSFPCKECGLVYKNPGSLKRHLNCKHAGSVSLDGEQTVSKTIPSQQSKTLPLSSKEFPCNICGKVLKSQKNIENRIEKVHGPSVHVSNSFATGRNMETRFPCSICNKVLASKINLDNHLAKVHVSSSQSLPVDSAAQTQTLEESTPASTPDATSVSGQFYHVSFFLPPLLSFNRIFFMYPNIVLSCNTL